MFTNLGREVEVMQGSVDAETIADKLKKTFIQNEGNVDVFTIEAFLADFRQLGVNSGVVGFEVIDELGDKINSFKDLEVQLMVKGILIIELQFDDGAKFEVVTRVNHHQQKVYTYCYMI